MPSHYFSFTKICQYPHLFFQTNCKYTLSNFPHFTPLQTHWDLLEITLNLYIQLEKKEYFFRVYFIDYAIIVVTFFLPFIPLTLYSSPTRTHHPLNLFMSMGGTYKFFCFSISYTVLNLPPSILYLPIMLLIPCTFSPFPIFPLPLSTDNPPLISISATLFLLQLFTLFSFQVHLVIVVSLLSFYCSYF